VIVVAFGLLIATCGDGKDGAIRSPGAGSTGTSQPAADAAGAFVGLTKSDAIARATAEGRPYRVGREDARQFLLTQDYQANRVTFEIDAGKVTKATLG
jgi:hypothetical protein